MPAGRRVHLLFLQRAVRARAPPGFWPNSHRAPKYAPILGPLQLRVSARVGLSTSCWFLPHDRRVGSQCIGFSFSTLYPQRLEPIYVRGESLGCFPPPIHPFLPPFHSPIFSKTRACKASLCMSRVVIHNLDFPQYVGVFRFFNHKIWWFSGLTCGSAAPYL